MSVVFSLRIKKIIKVNLLVRFQLMQNIATTENTLKATYFGLKQDGKRCFEARDEYFACLDTMPYEKGEYFLRFHWNELFSIQKIHTSVDLYLRTGDDSVKPA